MFERLTDRARRVLVLAQEEARIFNHSFIGTEHLLLGLIHEGDGVAAKALASLDITLEAVREKVEQTIGMASSMPASSPPYTPRAKKVLELSLREALQLHHSYIGTEHLLLGLVREGEGVAAQVLISLGADLGRVRQRVILLMSGNDYEPDLASRTAGVALEFHGEVAKLVACSFCGQQPPMTGPVVSGEKGAFICSHCVHDWAVRLARSDTGPTHGNEAEDQGPSEDSPEHDADDGS